MSKFKPGTVSPAVFPTRRAAERPKQTNNRFGSHPTGVLLEAAEADSPQTMPATDEPEPSGGALRLAFVMTMAFVFFRFSFLHELITAKIGVDLHLLLIVGGAAVFAAVASGGILIGLLHRISLAWFGFAGCMLFATIFSIWKGGSFDVFYPYLRTTLILVVLIPAVTQSTKSLTNVLKMIGVAGLATILLGLTVSDFRTGRLELSGAGSSASNSNDYAAIVILVMPAIAYLTLRRGTNFVFKVGGCAALTVGCFLVLSTGSRGALLSMVFTTLYILKVSSGKVRVAILVGLPLLALLAIPFLPGESAARLRNMFSSQHITSEAAESQEQRTALLLESLRTTAQHPLLGVGPGTFQEYQAQLAAKNGQRGMWHETHNSYTQASSECGIPAFLFFVIGIFMTYRVFARGRKSANTDIREISAILSLMVVSFSVCMFFLAQAYGFGFPVMGGIAIAIDRLMQRESEQLAVA